MRKHRINAGLGEGLDFERNHFRGKAAHRRRRRRKFEEKSRWLHTSIDGAYG